MILALTPIDGVWSLMKRCNKLLLRLLCVLRVLLDHKWVCELGVKVPKLLVLHKVSRLTTTVE